jgi:hypothetical protein
MCIRNLNQDAPRFVHLLSPWGDTLPMSSIPVPLLGQIQPALLHPRTMHCLESDPKSRKNEDAKYFAKTPLVNPTESAILLKSK